MKILYIAHEVSLGGATKSLLALIDEMIKKEHTVFVLVPSKEGELINELNKRRVRIFHKRYYSWMSNSKSLLSRVKTIIKFFLNRYIIFELKKDLNKYKIDIIHTNSLIINIGGYLRKFLNVPHVWHLREFGEEDHGLNFNFSQKKSMKFLNDNSDKVIVISNALKKKFENNINNEKITTIYNGISSNYLQKKMHIKEPQTINLLISGSLQEGKGQIEAVKACALLLENGQRNFLLHIAGKGNNEYIQTLKKIVSKNGLSKNVKFIGYIENVIDLRKSMDIELVCSRSEAFGRVSIEAMMSMNPVIASNSGANPELIQDGINGFLYQQGNSENLAEKISHILKNTNLISELGKNAYLYAVENYTAYKNANQIEEVYEKALQKINN